MTGHRKTEAALIGKLLALVGYLMLYLNKRKLEVHLILTHFKIEEDKG